MTNRKQNETLYKEVLINRAELEILLKNKTKQKQNKTKNKKA